MEITNQKATLFFETTEVLELESTDLNYLEVIELQKQNVDRQERNANFIFVVDAEALNKRLNNRFRVIMTIKERLTVYQDITSIKIEDNTYEAPHISNSNDDNILQGYFYIQQSGNLIVFANVSGDQISNMLLQLRMD